MVLLPAWKKAPFLRLLPPFIIGIITQWYIEATLPVILILFLFSFLVLAAAFRSDDKRNYKWKTLFGFSVQILFVSAGMLITCLRDTADDNNKVDQNCDRNDVLEVRLTEPLSEKQTSYKTTAEIKYISKNNCTNSAGGKLIIYFEKDSSVKSLHYGSLLQFSGPLQPIRNSGNPGAFNYQQYCAFRGIYHQVYLRKDQFYSLKNPYPQDFQGLLWRLRHKVLDLLRKNLSGRDETAIAEALIIGYRDDLDKDLVQSYSNTGVVHIIAISGLHLGLIYGLLIFLLKPLQKKKRYKWPRVVITLVCLWMFSLIAGGTPSVLRSAVMFSFLITGEAITRNKSRYNTLGASAFFLLCFHPFYLWDVGFQLSYAAVLSIMLFMRPIYNWMVLQNKLLDRLWKITSVTLSAQILTLPLCVYHFHQVPNLFLVSNLVAVPLGSLILYSELLLCCLGLVGIGLKWMGAFVSVLLHWMNTFIRWVDSFSFAVTDDIFLNIPQVILIYLVILCLSCWLLLQWKRFRTPVLIFLLLFLVARSVSYYFVSAQKKIIVYNVPGRSAIDFIYDGVYRFCGDSILLQSGVLQNIHLKPARIINRTSAAGFINCMEENALIHFESKKLLIINHPLPETFPGKTLTPVDFIILSHNPDIRIGEITERFPSPEFIIDGSNKWWKIRQWKNECEILNLRCHSTPDEGAFVLDL